MVLELLRLLTLLSGGDLRKILLKLEFIIQFYSLPLMIFEDIEVMSASMLKII